MKRRRKVSIYAVYDAAMMPHAKVAKLLYALARMSVNPSVGPSLCLSVCLSVCLLTRLLMFIPPSGLSSRFTEAKGLLR